jgi:hypothetical protein
VKDVGGKQACGSLPMFEDAVGDEQAQGSSGFHWTPEQDRPRAGGAQAGGPVLRDDLVGRRPGSLSRRIHELDR